MANEERNVGVLVQVCIECGREYMYDRQEPPAEQRCEKCGNGVFRSFYAESQPGEAIQDFDDTTARDLNTDDPGTDVTRGDLHDLNNP